MKCCVMFTQNKKKCLIRLDFIVIFVMILFSPTTQSWAEKPSISNDLSISIPSATYGGNSYSVTLDYYERKPHSDEHLWALSSVKETPTPVYVSVVIHYEDSFVFDSKDYYLQKRSDLVSLSEYLSENGIKINIQPDWALIKAMDNYEDDPVLQSQTKDKNVLRYLVEDLGHEVDPHSHENFGYNIADVACMLTKYGINPGNIVGGLIVSPLDESKYDQYLTPVASGKYPGYFWNAKWLWGDATPGHTDDTFATGVWRPKNTAAYYEHDDESPLICIGKYQNDLDGMYDLVEKLTNGKVPAGKIYTTTVFIGQGYLPNYLAEFQNNMENLKSLESDGKIIFASLEEVGYIWIHEFNKEENLYIKE